LRALQNSPNDVVDVGDDDENADVGDHADERAEFMGNSMRIRRIS